MSELGCKTARRWLQCVRELSPLDTRRLDRHLLQCRSCAELHRSNLEIERLITDALSIAAAGQSVRTETMRVLEGFSEQDTAARVPEQREQGRVRPEPILRNRNAVAADLPPGRAWKHRARQWASVRRSLTLPRPRRAWLVAPLAVAVLAAAALVPGISSRLGSPAVPAGAAWHVLRANVSFPVAVDPTRADHLLAGAAGRVYQSWNGGRSWQPLAPIPPGVIRALAIDVSAPSHYLVAVKNSVYLSSDAGKRWVVTASGLPGAENMFLLQQPGAPSVFYLGPSVLWRSENHGYTWRPAGQNIFAPNGIQSLAVTSSGDLYTAVWGGGVAVSRNGGRTWRRLIAGLDLRTFDVAADAHALWAATASGIYESRDRGRRWVRSGPQVPFAATSILDAGSYLLAGGEGAIFRSSDAGKTWRVVTSGLPLSPYVYNLEADPHRPDRVYASLDTDGIFRSDDGGVHWTAVDAGLPLNAGTQTARTVLFRRHGILWITDALGTDPESLTVDNRVKIAATSPDGAAVAYVTGDSSSWAARMVGAGGSAATAIASGSGTLPARMLWAPGSSAVVLSTGTRIFLLDLRSGRRVWTAPAGEALLGWSDDGKSLLFWRPARSQVVSRSPLNGDIRRIMAGIYPSLPVPAPDGMHLALIDSGHLYTGSWNRALRPAASLPAGCTLGSWSPDSSRLLVRCGSIVQERGRGGRVLASARLMWSVFWAPGGSSAQPSAAGLLYFHHGLRLWSPHRGSRLIVSSAASVQPHA